MYKVRFHLGKGKHFLHWQIKNIETNTVEYLDPNIFSLKLYNCQLKNYKNVAKKIHSGENKTVCAWIKCDYYEIGQHNDNTKLFNQVSYNPRVLPNWFDENQNDIDNKKFDRLYTYKNKLFNI